MMDNDESEEYESILMIKKCLNDIETSRDNLKRKYDCLKKQNDLLHDLIVANERIKELEAEVERLRQFSMFKFFS